MYIDDLKNELADYKNLPKRRLNKALDAKITIIPSQRIFGHAMYKIGVDQRKRQHVRLVVDKEYFKRHTYTKNNTLKLSKETIVFEDFIDERKFKVEKGKTVDIYTRKYKRGIGGGNTETVLEVAYILDGELLVINPIEKEEI